MSSEYANWSNGYECGKKVGSQDSYNTGYREGADKERQANRANYEDGRIKGARDMQMTIRNNPQGQYREGLEKGQQLAQALTKKICELEDTNGMRYAKGHKDGYAQGHTEASDKVQRNVYDRGHKDGYTRGRATMKITIEDMIMEVE